MDGHFQNNQRKYNEIMDLWASKVIDGKLWTKFDDLHIDEVEPLLKGKKELWPSFGLKLFESFVRIIDKKQYSSVLVFHLTSGREKLKQEQLTFSSLKDLMSHTPPSIYLFPHEESSFVDTISSANFMENLSIEINLKAHFNEALDDNEYDRTIYIRD